MGKAFDVVVCGGGTAGSVAAIRAARLGLRTALVERQSQLGGTSTLALVTPVMPNEACGVELVAGIHRELHDELARQGFGDLRGFDPIWAAMILEQWAVEAGVTIYYHTELLGVRRASGRLAAVELAALGTRFELCATSFIDATGDCLVAAMAGEPVREGREPTGEHQPCSLRFMLAGVDLGRVLEYLAANTPAGVEYAWPCDPDGRTRSIHPAWLEPVAARSEYLRPWKDQLSFNFYTIPGRPDAVCFNTPRVLCGNVLDPAMLSSAYIDGRRQIEGHWRFFRERVPGFENSYISHIAPLLGIRECRRIAGQFTLTENDVREFVRFDDAVCRCNYAIDIHHNTDGGATLWYLPRDRWYEVPYRAMLPATARNLIVAGRCISTDFVAQSSYRIIPICRGLGEAAAYACAEATRKGTDLAGLAGQDVKQKLLDDEVVVVPG